MNTYRIAVTTAAVLGVALLGSPPAWADAGPHASCIGIESSSISPPGTTDEFPGGRSEASHLVKDLAGQFGITPGAIISSVAHLHAGSHLACDEATE